jgi:hypothetical protein
LSLSPSSRPPSSPSPTRCLIAIRSSRTRNLVGQAFRQFSLLQELPSGRSSPFVSPSILLAPCHEPRQSINSV